MLPNTSHAPTTPSLEKLDTAVTRVQANLRDHILVDCHSHRLRKIAGHLDLLKEVAEELRREIAEHIAGAPEIIPMVPCYGDLLDCGLLHDSPEPWFDESEAEHPANCSCPGCIDKALREGQYEVGTLALANSGLDRRPA